MAASLNCATVPIAAGMEPVTEEEKPIRVVDRRMFTADGELRPDVETEERPEPPKRRLRPPAPANAGGSRAAALAGRSRGTGHLPGIPDPRELSRHERLRGPRHRRHDRQDAAAPRPRGGAADDRLARRPRAEDAGQPHLRGNRPALPGALRAADGLRRGACVLPAGSRRRRAGNGHACHQEGTAPGATRPSAVCEPRPCVPASSSCCCSASAAQAQDALSPLPPPVTRSLYRAHWFEFLSAFSENDAAARSQGAGWHERAARKVGVRRLSDFSRTAVYLGRRAEKQGQPDRAERAYEAALALDDANPDAILAHLSFLVRHGRVGDALRILPEAATALFCRPTNRGSRSSPSLGTWTAAAAAATLVGVDPVARRCGTRPASVHDMREAAFRLFGRSGGHPARPRHRGPAALRRARARVAAALLGRAALCLRGRPGAAASSAPVFVALALVPPLAAWITQDNIRQRSPLFVAAIDLEERREDASAEDGLRQAAAVFPEDSDVWFLLGIYAERVRGPRARPGRLRPRDAGRSRRLPAHPEPRQRPLHRGRLRRGDPRLHRGLASALRNPRTCTTTCRWRAARPTISTARPARSRRARAISASQVAGWSSNPTLSRVVPAGYPLARARSRIERVERPAQEPAPAGPRDGGPALASPALAWTLAPLGAWLARRRARAPARARRGWRLECERCGRAVLQSLPALRRSDALLRDVLAPVPAQGRVPTSRSRWPRPAQMQQRASWPDARARASPRSLLPGSRAFFEERPLAGAITLFLFFFGLAAALHRRAPLRSADAAAPGGLRATVVRRRALAARRLGARAAGRRGGLPVGLEGTLKVFSLTDIFQMLGLQRKTGVLVVEGEDDTVTISFLGGQVVAAESARAPARQPARQPPAARGLRHAGAARPRARDPEGDAAADGLPARARAARRAPGAAGGAAAPDLADRLRRVPLAGRALSVQPGGHGRLRRRPHGARLDDTILMEAAQMRGRVAAPREEGRRPARLVYPPRARESRV